MNPEKWEELTLAQQLGNIGSAFSRAVKTKNYGEVLELLDLTIADKRWVLRLKEPTRLREVICDQILEAKIYDVKYSALHEYFLAFGVAARNTH